MHHENDAPCAANDNVPQLAGDHPYRTTTKFQRDAGGKLLRDRHGHLVPLVVNHGSAPKEPSTPEERAAARFRSTEARKAEAARMRPALAAIRRRQNVGDPACAANDNESFPLLAALRREKNEALVSMVLRYRKLVALVEAQPLQGVRFSSGQDGRVEHRADPLAGPEAVDAAAGAGWQGDKVPGGEIRYRSEVKRSRGAFPLPAKRARPVDAEKQDQFADEFVPVSASVALAKPFSDEVLIQQLDAKPLLSHLRSSLGPLLGPFEDATLGGRTYAEIGRADGVKVKPDVAGKALVMRALTTLDAAWHEHEVEQRRLSKAAARAVAAARKDIASRQWAFGKAA